MLSADDESAPSSESTVPPSSMVSGSTLTGSDLVKGGETSVLLVSDTLGRVGLLRYPAELHEPPTVLPVAEVAAGQRRVVLYLPTFSASLQRALHSKPVLCVVSLWFPQPPFCSPEGTYRIRAMPLFAIASSGSVVFVKQRATLV